MTNTSLHPALKPDEATPDRLESGAGRHRSAGSAAHPATLLTAAIAIAAVGVAGFVATQPGSAGATDLSRAEASLSGAVPAVAEGAASSVRESAQLRALDRGSARIDKISDRFAALQAIQGSALAGAEAAGERAVDIAAERRAAAEQAAQERAAAEQAAAEQAAAEQAAAEQAAQERDTHEHTASRSQERTAAPAAAPAPAPAPSGDPRSIARSMLGSYGWSSDQFGCLDSLWTKESGWNTYAANPSSGAYGIPQSLPGSKMGTAGSDWRTNPATQIRWGLGYISGRYGTPCSAWAHSQAVNWY